MKNDIIKNKKKQLFITTSLSLFGIIVCSFIGAIENYHINTVLSSLICCFEYIVWLIFYNKNESNSYVIMLMAGVSIYISLTGHDLIPFLFELNPFVFFLIICFSSLLKFLIIKEQEEETLKVKQFE